MVCHCAPRSIHVMCASPGTTVCPCGPGSVVTKTSGGGQRQRLAKRIVPASPGQLSFSEVGDRQIHLHHAGMLNPSLQRAQSPFFEEIPNCLFKESRKKR